MAYNPSKYMQKLALLALLLSALPVSPSFAGLYKWVDKSGDTHYGDIPPPVNTQYGHKVLSNSGLHIMTVNRDLTDAEQQVANRAIREEKLQLRKEIERERIDTVLADSFPTFDTLNTVRNERLSALDSSIAYLQSRRDDQVEERGSNNARMQHFHRIEIAIPHQLTSDALIIDRKISQLDTQISSLLKDRSDTAKEFKKYSDRLKELLGIE